MLQGAAGETAQSSVQMLAIAVAVSNCSWLDAMLGRHSCPPDQQQAACMEVSAVSKLGARQAFCRGQELHGACKLTALAQQQSRTWCAGRGRAAQ